MAGGSAGGAGAAGAGKPAAHLAGSGGRNRQGEGFGQGGKRDEARDNDKGGKQ